MSRRKPPVRRVEGDQGGWIGTPAALRTRNPETPSILVRNIPLEECHLCGCDVFFVSYGGRLICASCHSPVDAPQLVQGKTSQTPINVDPHTGEIT